MSDWIVQYELDGGIYGPFVTKDAARQWAQQQDNDEAYALTSLIPIDMKDGGRPPEEITDEMINDILETALYSGISYWCAEAVVAWPVGGTPVEYQYTSEILTKGGMLVIVCHDDEEPRNLDRDKMEAGMRRAAAHQGQTMERWHDDHDAMSADLAVQYAVFGEVVYG